MDGKTELQLRPSAHRKLERRELIVFYQLPSLLSSRSKIFHSGAAGMHRCLLGNCSSVQREAHRGSARVQHSEHMAQLYLQSPRSTICSSPCIRMLRSGLGPTSFGFLPMEKDPNSERHSVQPSSCKTLLHKRKQKSCEPPFALQCSPSTSPAAGAQQGCSSPISLQEDAPRGSAAPQPYSRAKRARPVLPHTAHGHRSCCRRWPHLGAAGLHAGCMVCTHPAPACP